MFHYNISSEVARPMVGCWSPKPKVEVQFLCNLIYYFKISIVSPEFEQMVQKLLPNKTEQDAFFASFREPLKKSISIQRHKSPNFETQHSQFVLSESSFHEFPDTIYVDRTDMSIALGKTRQHLTGEFYIQEVAAALPANILKWYLKELYTRTQEPLRLLDTCAAPGGKTAQIADFLIANHIPWWVWGNDVETKRLWTRATNIQRCGLYNTLATKLDASQIWNLYPEYFDAILVDAPCSGEWTGFKSDAAYKWRKEESINKIVGLQEHIVTSAVKACKPGGIIIYSTCTLNPFENELQIKKLLDKYGDALEILSIDVKNKSTGIVYDPTQATGHEDKMLRAWPHIHNTWWFFVCAMRKTKSTIKPVQEHITNNKKIALQQAKINHKKSTQPPFTYNKKLEQQMGKIILDVYGIDIDFKKYALIQGKHKIYLTDASVRDVLDMGVWLYECGIPILKSTGATWSLEHEFALTLWNLATLHTLPLTTEQLQKYCLWESIDIDESLITTSDNHSLKYCNNYYILTHNGQGIGVGKILGNSIKNKFFKW